MITLLMSVYSGETAPNFRASFDSILNQTVKPNEIILVIDGSIHSSVRDLVNRYTTLLPIKVVQIEKNVGLANALNVGLQYASNEWIMRFDTDDICLPRRIELQHAIINSNKFDLFGAQIAEFDSTPDSIVRLRPVPCSSDDIREFCILRNPFNHMTVCYRKSLVLKFGGYPNVRFMEDYALWLMLISSGARVANMPDILVHVRTGSAMISRRGGFCYAMSEFQIQKLMFRLGLKSLTIACWHGIIRSTIFVLPASFRSRFYNYFLRKPYK